MKTWKSLLIGMAVTVGLSAAAQEWDLSIGISYRTLGDLDIDRRAFENPSDPFVTGPYVTGSDMFPDGGDLIYVTDLAKQTLQLEEQDNGYDDAYMPVRDTNSYMPDYAALHTVDFGGASEELESAWGLTLSAKNVIRETDNVRWKFVLNFLTFGADEDSSYTQDGQKTVWQTIPYLWGWENPNAGPADPPTGQPDTQGYFQNVVGTLAFDFDVNAYTFGAGIGAEIPLGDFGSLEIDAGPSLTIVDYDMSLSESVVWEDSSPLYSRRMKDDDVEIEPGLFAEIGYRLDITESFGIGIGGRYDYISTMETSFGSADLSGWSGFAKAVMRF